MLGGSFSAPDDARGSTGGVEAGVGTVALVGSAELAMSLGALLWESMLSALERRRLRMKYTPLSDKPLLAEKRRVEGRKILRRRPEKDMVLP